MFGPHFAALRPRLGMHLGLARARQIFELRQALRPHNWLFGLRRHKRAGLALAWTRHGDRLRRFGKYLRARRYRAQLHLMRDGLHRKRRHGLGLGRVIDVGFGVVDRLKRHWRGHRHGCRRMRDRLGNRLGLARGDGFGLAGSGLRPQALRHFGQPCLGKVGVLRASHHIDAGGHNRNPDNALQALVECRAQDDIGIIIDFLADAAGSLVHFIQRQVIAAGDRDQQAARPAHRHFIEQRIGNRRFRRKNGAAFAGCFAGAHHRLAHFAHCGAHIGKIEVDQAILDHQVGDAGNARIQHLVGHGEGIGKSGLLVGDAKQVLVGDNDQRIDRLLQFDNARFRRAHPALAFELERLCHDADCENAHVAGNAGNDRGSARAGAAAHAGGDKHHMRAHHVVADFLDGLLGGGAPDFGLRSGPKALGDLQAKLDDALGLGFGQGLGIGVGNDEIDAGQAGFDHVIDRIAAGPPNAAHHDAGLELAQFRTLQIDRHRLASPMPGFVLKPDCLFM